MFRFPAPCRETSPEVIVTLWGAGKRHHPGPLVNWAVTELKAGASLGKGQVLWQPHCDLDRKLMTPNGHLLLEAAGAGSQARQPSLGLQRPAAVALLLAL